MPSVDLRLTFPTTSPSPVATTQIGTTNNNPLPTLLQTPSGLAILEIQGTIHAPFPQTYPADSPNDHQLHNSGKEIHTDIGRLEFPLYNSTEHSAAGEGKWMKKVYLYAGKHQRLTGEVKKLAKPLGVVRKITRNEETIRTDADEDAEIVDDEALEMVDIVRYKIVFAGRPEPVGGE